MKEELKHLEEELLTSEVRASREKLDTLLHTDFVEYGSSGKEYRKSDILQRLPLSLSPKYVLSNFESVSLSKDLAQTRYVTNMENEDGTYTVSLRSSIWKMEEGGWKMYFHQGTPIAK